MTRQEQIINRCRELFAVAKEKFNVDMSDVAIRFDLKGRAAGQAGHRLGDYFIRFNYDMIQRDAFDSIMVDTISHEIAHIVCFKKPELGRGHDMGWKRVNRMLGGTGERCHKEEVVLGRGHTYEYITDRGHRVRVGDRHHTMVEYGRTLNFRNNMGAINKNSPVRIVGKTGKSLTQPVVVRGHSAWALDNSQAA